MSTLIMLLEGLTALVGGMWLLRKASRAPSRSRKPVRNRDLEYRLKRAGLESRLALQKLEMKLLELKRKELELKQKELASAESRELDRLVLEDALKREERAKAAMVAVLQAQGCNENLIQYVLKTVGNEPD